jgi:hypothetical protein
MTRAFLLHRGAGEKVPKADEGGLLAREREPLTRLRQPLPVRGAREIQS